ncbi:DUF4129 domain-containing protein [Amnibacterium kyonggiense]|uniref:Uncharacterized protein DUF4129 n=1 Tax=Amnibacterium kyonggiense TaxID=595671 RepID=A0A4R7FSQ5_9MICO|nr:DUF4129 domain-containing protein [Amnibacterium kyonggiense]TDS80901.1 uncharacterized protein DUF4129 [Amnibacterium kyonggiense]
MRRQDGEPDGAAPVRRGATGRWLLPLVVAGAAVVVLSTALEGPALVVPLFGSNGGGQPVEPPTPVQPVATLPPQGQGMPRIDVNSTIGTIILVLAALVGLAIAFLLIRLILSAVRGRRKRIGLRGTAALDAEPQVADAPTVLRGIAAALAAFDEDREPSDAVIRAWLGLQQAAEDAGLARSPAETPTEFTGRVLSRTGADRAASRTLLGLYLRARFGDGVVAAADASAAQQALRVLETSWERVDA